MKPYTLTNREGESISPMTSTKTVFDEKGVDLDTLLMQQRQDGENALKDYAKKTEVTQDLSGKQDKLSTTIDLHITDDNILGLTEKGSRKMFDEMFKDAVGGYGDIDHTHYEDGVNKPYYLNELWLTDKEAVAVYKYLIVGYKGYPATKSFVRPKVKTFTIWLDCASTAGATDFTLVTGHSHDLKTFRIADSGTSKYVVANAFSVVNCFELKSLLGVIDVLHIKNTFTPFTNCPKLEEVAFRRLSSSINLSGLPLLSLASVNYLVENAANTSTITITVHPDVYEKLTDTNNTEWYAQLTAAAAKNISFATI